MGSAFSKRKRSPEAVSAAGRQVDSAPARLDGGGVAEAPEAAAAAAHSAQRRPGSADGAFRASAPPMPTPAKVVRPPCNDAIVLIELVPSCQ